MKTLIIFLLVTYTKLYDLSVKVRKYLRLCWNQFIDTHKILQEYRERYEEHTEQLH